MKYAKFKAVEIVKAIKTGAKMVSGPPNGEVEIQNLTSPSISNFDPVTPNITNAENISLIDKTKLCKPIDSPKPPVVNTPLSNPVIKSVPAAPQLAQTAVPTKEVDYNEENAKVLIQAGKHAKYAQSALMYDDIRTAVDNLEKALALLKPLNQ
jgi:vacuolar protein sorting-associated protein VTA1